MNMSGNYHLNNWIQVNVFEYINIVYVYNEEIRKWRLLIRVLKYRYIYS